jgi:hypothetical protein
MQRVIILCKTYSCPVCGENQDLSYIEWEGRYLCSHCWAREVAEYAEKYPFMMAQEMGLSLLHVPEV